MVLQEEAAMVSEVATYGFVLNRNQPVQARDVDINEKLFDPKNVTKRPPGWSEMRTKRVLMKEFVICKDSNDEEAIVAGRSKRIEAVVYHPFLPCCTHHYL